MNEEANQAPDLSEKGRGTDGQVISSDRRLFFQFHAFEGAADPAGLIEVLAASNLDAALYRDANDPTGVGICCCALDPQTFIDEYQAVLREPAFAALRPKPEFTMFGRTYSIGYESNLDTTLVKRPYGRLVNPKLEWVIWYPLRRSGAFALLDPKEQRKILGEHGTIGVAFGSAGLASDIRLACFGLDKEDNDFIIGLLGKELFPLSAVVQTMRATIQTSTYIEKLGPFFVGRVIWQAEKRDLLADVLAETSA